MIIVKKQNKYCNRIESNQSHEEKKYDYTSTLDGRFSGVDTV